MVEVFEDFSGRMGRRATRCSCKFIAQRVPPSREHAPLYLADVQERWAQVVADKAMYRKPPASQPQWVLQFPAPKTA